MSVPASASLAAASKNSCLLYRAILKTIPSALLRFNVPHSEAEVRKRVRAEFLKHADVTDPELVDYLNFRGRLELEEITEMWKQKPHLLHWLDSPMPAVTRKNERIVQRTDQDDLLDIINGRV